MVESHSICDVTNNVMVWSNINISHRSKLISKGIRTLLTTRFYDKQKNCNICALVSTEAKPRSKLRSLEDYFFGNPIRTAVKLTFFFSPSII